MTVSTDQNAAPAPLSPNALRMRALQDAVFGVWEARVRERIQSARALQHPILVDTLPVFYSNIVESISPDYPRTSAVDGNTVAAEHGGERARITAYDHAALIEEYQIMRWAIFEVLHREGVRLDHQETHAIHSSIDSGIQEAVEAFSLVHSGLRERFAAALTHDMRGPLAAMMTGLQLIGMTDDPVRMQRLAESVLGNTRRVSGMVDELLDTMAFHGGQTLHLDIVEVDIFEVADEVRSEAVAAYGPRIEVHGSSIQGWWDRAALKRVVENLVTNAVKYGSPDTPIRIVLAQGHERLKVQVHNQGNPIPHQEQECIFQMYRRSEAAKHSAKGGWGIGLPYVRAVVESHAGSIAVDSSLDRGTTFTVDLPLDGRLFRNAPSLAPEQVG